MIYYKKKIQQDVGATAVEYGILSALIAVVTILGLQATGTNLGTTYCTVANQLSQAVGAGATASGCSATSSSSSSSSSADSSGSSADSSSSDSSGSSNSSSDSSSSSSTQAEYNASNSYTVSDNLNGKYANLSALANGQIQDLAMSGIFNADGNEITTPQQYAEALGVSDADYNALANIFNGTEPNESSYNIDTTQGEQDYQSARQQALSSTRTKIQNEISSSGTSVYIPDPTKVTFTGLVGGVSTKSSLISTSGSSYAYSNNGGTLEISQLFTPPTGK